ncbi:MAG: hypothetical protein JW910_11095, partial [Anaerolineae bacterium]|nr:hypothetical protein [Anaerolineae bacterium]
MSHTVPSQAAPSAITLRAVREGFFVLLPALYLSRVSAEFLPLSPVFGALAGLLLGLSGAWWLRRSDPAPAWEALLLLPYVAFPWQSPQLALLCGLLAGVTWL